MFSAITENQPLLSIGLYSLYIVECSFFTLTLWYQHFYAVVVLINMRLKAECWDLLSYNDFSCMV